MVELPLVLLVHSASPLKKLSEILGQKPRPLISVPPTSALAKTFQDGLRKLGTSWEIGIELSTLEMVQTYCAAGYGIGLSILSQGIQFGPDLRVLRPRDFRLLKI